MNRAVSQVEMFPVTMELNPADYFILKEIEGELELLGFSIQSFREIIRLQ